MPQHRTGHFTRFLITVLLCAACFYAGYRYHHWKVYEQSEYLVPVVSVHDGDTINIDWFGGVAQVRIVGIDSFETRRSAKLSEQCKKWGIMEERGLQLAEMARQMLNEAVTDKLVRIRFPSRRIERDSFGRLLAYVYVDNVDLGLYLLSKGVVYPRPEAHIRDKYYEWPMMQAKNFKLGIFAEEGLPSHPPPSPPNTVTSSIPKGQP